MDEGQEAVTRKLGADRLRFLFEVMKTFAEATADHERVFQTVVEQTARFMDACVFLGLISEDHAWWRPVAHFAEDAGARQVLQRFMAWGRLRLTEAQRAMFSTPEIWPLVMHDPIPDAMRQKLNPDVLGMIEQLGARSYVVMPLMRRGELLGTLTLLRAGKQARRFDQAELDVLWTLADHAALTLANARLVEAVRTELADHARTREALAGSEAKALHLQRVESTGRLAGGVAHDFNNLLSVILSYAEMIAEDLREDDPMLFAAHEILTASRRGAEVTRQLLAFSRQQVLEPREIVLNRIVGGIEKMLRRLLGEDIDIRTRLARDLQPCRVDPSQIEQVLLQLVLNARDAMPLGGQLTIATSNVELDEAYVAEHPEATVGPHVMLSVADSGVGMDEATITRIFEPFFTTKPSSLSSGLGLSGVYGTVRQSGGSIAVESALGEGTTMRVYLPRLDRPPSTRRGSVTSQGSPLPTADVVLVVAPDVHLRTLLRDILERAGYKAHVAADEGEAILLASQRTTQVGLLVCDLDISRMQGSALARRLREAWPEMRALFLASAVAGSTAGVQDLGAHILLKPITPDALLVGVQDVFGV